MYKQLLIFHRISVVLEQSILIHAQTTVSRSYWQELLMVVLSYIHQFFIFGFSLKRFKISWIGTLDYPFVAICSMSHSYKSCQNFLRNTLGNTIQELSNKTKFWLPFNCLFRKHLPVDFCDFLIGKTKNSSNNRKHGIALSEKWLIPS